MRFEVSYTSGATHEVQLESAVATLGRDPTCDLVLNDPKCSRRHAVIEATPQGMVIRDQGSANGVFVNERKVDRGPVREGDVIRLGDVRITVLAEAMPGTVVMEEEEMDLEPAPAVRTATLPPLDDLVETRDDADDRADGGRVAAAARAAQTVPPTRESVPPTPALPGIPRPAVPARPSPPPRPAPPARPTAPPRPATPAAGLSASPPPRPAAPMAARARLARPLTVSVLAALWILSVPLYAAAGIALTASMKGAWAIGAAVTFALLAILGGLLAFGLWTGQGWARPLQIAVAAIGLLNCPFTIAAIVVLVYMLRAPARRYFAGEPPDDGASESEPAFAAGVVAAVVLGVLLTGALTFVARTVNASSGAPPVAAPGPFGNNRIAHG